MAINAQNISAGIAAVASVRTKLSCMERALQSAQNNYSAPIFENKTARLSDGDIAQIATDYAANKTALLALVNSLPDSL